MKHIPTIQLSYAKKVLNPNWVYTELFLRKGLLIRLGVFEPIRSEVYGPCKKTFEGTDQSEIISTFLQQRYPYSELKKIEMENKLHSFLYWEFKPTGSNSPQKWIIDPCWRETAYSHDNKENKMFSPFARYIFSSLPPVLIIEKEKYNLFYSQIENVRLKDPLHFSDNNNFPNKVSEWLEKEK